jgi:hypothetical protein
MAELVYMLCALASLSCAIILWRGFLRTRTRLLLWCSLCFAVFAANCIFLFIDLGLFPLTDLQGPFWRNLLGAAAGSLMLFGLIWEAS